ncbi:MAG: hypothetical protein KAW87_01490 [Candidatus Cloacimonetes bacterium]|nr:hypothetical protein [Candidatus Cloacimonadota bacterium]
MVRCLSGKGSNLISRGKSAFWLEFIIDEQIMKKERVILLLNEATELVSIFYASRKTAKENIS